MANATLSDAGCWLEQAEGIIELDILELEKHHDTFGSAAALALYGASSLIGRAKKTASDEEERLCASRAQPAIEREA